MNKKIFLQTYIILLLLGISLGARAIDGYTGGYHASGIDGTTVYLNDLEDHTWTYYSGVDASVDGGNYNTNYKGLIYSPNPRNVKITYNGVDLDGNLGTNVAVSATESQNQFVYFETLEKNPIAFSVENYANGVDYPYEVIPNPFSKRPVVTNDDATKTYYGFAGWKIVSGAEFIIRTDGTQASNGDVLNLEEQIHFTNLGDDDSNTPLFQIELAATWTPATVNIQSTKPTFTDGTYETNFWVVSGNVSTSASNPLPLNCTITNYTPDGVKNSSVGSVSGCYADKSSPTTVTTKLEYLSTSGSFSAQGRNLYIGRGVSGGGYLYTSYQLNTDINSTFRIESGSYNSYLGFYNGANTGAIDSKDPSDVTKHVVIFGSDFDRATANNEKLTVSGASTITSHSSNCQDTHKLMSRLYFKSGKFNTSSRGTSSGNSCFYFGTNCSRPLTYTRMGGRYVEIQGGIHNNLCGGYDSNQPYYNQDAQHDKAADGDATDRAFTLRIKGGTVRGVIYGAAQTAPGHGTRVFACTGGEVQGWIAAGANGSSSESGVLYGQSFIYAGGNFRCDTKNAENGVNYVINKAIGGYIFGAGCGLSADNKAGEVKLGTNVVVADNAYVEHGVYGGGAYGYCNTEKAATLYMTGGTIEGKAGGAISGSYTADIKGGLFGGASLNKGGNSNIYMTGGTVGGVGVYGGSNYSGTLSGNTNVNILGGTVGGTVNGSTYNANVHGGGYGSSTIVTGNVDVTVGGTATVNGSVYGGSALGKTNNANTTSSKTMTTKVTMTGGTINGSLFGGGLGSTAAVTTNPVVTMSGGTVTQNVFGGGDAAKVDGNTSVTIKGPSHVGNNVYGGGNAAEVTGTTHVQIGEKKE